MVIYAWCRENIGSSHVLHSDCWGRISDENKSCAQVPAGKRHRKKTGTVHLGPTVH